MIEEDLLLDEAGSIVSLAFAMGVRSGQDMANLVWEKGGFKKEEEKSEIPFYLVDIKEVKKIVLDEFREEFGSVLTIESKWDHYEVIYSDKEPYIVYKNNNSKWEVLCRVYCRLSHQQ